MLRFKHPQIWAFNIPKMFLKNSYSVIKSFLTILKLLLPEVVMQLKTS